MEGDSHCRSTRHISTRPQAGPDPLDMVRPAIARRLQATLARHWPHLSQVSWEDGGQLVAFAHARMELSAVCHRHLPYCGFFCMVQDLSASNFNNSLGHCQEEDIRYGNLQAANSELVTACHACSFLSDEVLFCAIESRSPVVLLPCCYEKVPALPERPWLPKWSWKLGQFGELEGVGKPKNCAGQVCVCVSTVSRSTVPTLSIKRNGVSRCRSLCGGVPFLEEPPATSSSS